MFLNDIDYRGLIRDEILIRIMDGDTTLRHNAELYAQKVIESYLRHKYDVVAIFSAMGSQRDAMIITYVIDIALHQIHSRITPSQIPDIRMQRYETALSWLKAVSKGDISPDLPLNSVVADSSLAEKSGFVVKSALKQNFEF